MTVLSASKDRPVKLPPGGVHTAAVKLAGYTNFGDGNTAHTVYKGSVVICDVSDTDGYFRLTVPMSYPSFKIDPYQNRWHGVNNVFHEIPQP